MPDWEPFKTRFRSKSANRERYIELRTPVSDDLGQVALILFARGTGYLRADTLEDIASRYEILWELLQEADRTMDKSRVKAIAAVSELAEPAQQLHADAVLARDVEEKREKQRQEDLAKYEEQMENALLLISNITDLGGPDANPIKIVDNLGNNLDKLQALIEDDEVMTAIGLLNGIVSALPKLEEAIVTLAALRKRTPEVLPTSDAQNLAKWDAAVINAVAKSSPDAVVDPLGNYLTFIVRYERDRDIRAVISGIHPAKRYEGLKLRVDDIRGFPAEFSSPAVKAHKKTVNQAAAKVQTRLQVLAEKEQALEDAVSPNELERLDLEEKIQLATEAANEELEKLERKLTTAARDVGDHNTAMRKYYARLKKIKRTLDLAEASPEQESGVDTAWKAEKQAYVQAKAAVTAEVDAPKRDYVAGLTKLDELEVAVKALADKRAEALQGSIDVVTDGTSGSAHKTATLVSQLAQTPGLLKALKPEQQLTLLKSLREQVFFCTDCDENFSEADFKSAGYECPTCNSADHLQVPAYCSRDTCLKPGLWTPINPCTDCGNDDWHYDSSVDTAKWDNGEDHPNRALFTARAQLLAELSITPEFEAKDKQMKRDTIEEIREDPEFLVAQKNWKTWAADFATHQSKIEAYLNRVLAIQCRIFGHSQKGLKRSRGGVEETFADVPVKVTFVTPSPAKPGDYGACLPGFPTWIELNTTCRQFDDFKEIVDTIVHENAHAFQEMLIKKLKAEAPFTATDRDGVLNDNDLKVQAQLFLENDESYINRGDLGTRASMRDLADRAYRHEPLEEHAWGVGGTISKALLVPPPKEDFRSRKTLRSKIWQVKSATMAQETTVKLTERHGIYVDEWEGEQASDKTLYLEHLLRGGQRVSKRVRVVNVVDAKTLLLNLDTRTWDEDTDATGFVAGKGAILRLDERVVDL